MCRYICVGFLLAIISCQSRQSDSPGKIVETGVTPIAAAETTKNIETASQELLGFFTDDSKIGESGNNKIEISHFKVLDRDKIEIKFYSLEKNKNWHLKQTFEFEKFGSLDIDAKLEDFNNDGFKDVTYVSDIAARGANEIRKLLIYDKKRDELIHIKNSDDYPNLRYNKKLNCLDAYLVYGGTSTVFLKIDGDSLEEFANVESFGNKRTISVIDKNGKEKVLRTDKIEEDEIYERYENFNPLQPYRDNQ